MTACLFAESISVAHELSDQPLVETGRVCQKGCNTLGGGTAQVHVNGHFDALKHINDRAKG